MEPTHLPARRFNRDAPERDLLPERRIGNNILYRFYDAEQQPLYVGITQTGAARLAAHRRRSVWWPRAEYIAISVYPDRSTLEEAERAAIRAESPLFNKAGARWRQQTLLRLDGDPKDFAAALHRIARPDFVAEVAALLAQPAKFPQPLPPPPAHFTGSGPTNPINRKAKPQ